MGWIDKVISALSPSLGYRREVWRQGLTELRGYDAADNGRLNSGWRVFNESAELTDRYSRDTVRARARDLERNSDIAQAVVHAYKRNVVGKGFTLRSLTPDEELNKRLERAWKRWCMAENCDVTGEQSFNEILRMMVVRKKFDGGMLAVFRYTDEGMMPFKLQCLEVDELDTSRNVPRYAGNRVVGGVEYNAWRRPVGYWIRQYDIEGMLTLESVFIDARDVFFYKSKNRPSQLREISDMAPTVTRIRDTNEFITAVSVRERIAACLAVLIKKALPSVGTVGRTVTKAPDGRVDYAGKKLSPGLMMEMGPGDDAQIVDPKGAATDATAFLKTQQGLIAAGQGLSYEAVSRDMVGATYSSARQNAIEDESTYAEETELICAFMSEVYEKFVTCGVLTGLFSIPDFWRRTEDYLEHSWVKAPKKWIEPTKETTADKIALQSGQKTFQDMCAERGKDWKEAVDEMAEVLSYGRERGIELGGVIFGEKTSDAGDTGGAEKGHDGGDKGS